MAVDGFARIVKYLLFVVNVIFWLCGLLLLIFGIWAFADKDFSNNLTTWSNKVTSEKEIQDELSQVTGYVKIGAIIIMVAGIVTFIIGFLGCCGAMKESKLFLTLYALFVSVILIVLIAGGIYTLIKREDAISKLVSNTKTRVLEKDQEKINAALKAIQPNVTNEAIIKAAGNAKAILLLVFQNLTQLECCGVHNSYNYTTTTSVTCKQLQNTICPNLKECPKEQTTSGETGCTQAMQRYIEGQLSSNLNRIGIAAIIIAAFMALCIASAIFVFRSIESDTTV